MTILISDNSPRISYTATAGQTVFTVPFEFFDNSDLNVYINDALKTITTDYTVTGGDGSTGTVTLVTGATVGDAVVITRDVTLERVTDFPTSGPFQVASLNVELDKLVAMVADLKDLANRSLRLSDSDLTASLTLASPDDRKGTVLAFNATTGDAEVGPTIVDVSGSSANATAAASSATAAASSAVSAANSAAAAAAAFDSFDDTYLGSFTSDPTTDNDGNPLVEGALYFNSPANEMRVYDGANWIAATSSGAATMNTYKYTAVALQQAFGGSDDSGSSLSYSVNNLIVTLNGLVLENGTDYTATDGTSIVLTVAASVNDELNIIAFTSFSVGEVSVNSVNGQNGVVVLDADDISDASTTNKYTTAGDISKLAGIATGAEVNAVDSVNTQTGAVVLDADDISDTATTNKYTTAGDISKLAGIEANATADQTAAEIKTAYESNADTNEFSDAEQSKLAGIEASATADQTGAEIASAISGETVATLTVTNLTAGGLSYPTSDGTTDQVLKTDGSGNISFATVSAGGAVDSVNTQTGTVVLDAADVGALALTGGTLTGDLSFGDDDKAVFGAGSDLEIYHTGAASRIQDTGTGNLYIAGTNLQLTDSTITDNYLQAVSGGALTIYHSGDAKLATTATGIDVTGTVTADGGAFTGDVTFGDSNKAIFGAGSDLEIFHDSNDSIISDTGTGDLIIKGANNIYLKDDSDQIIMRAGKGIGARLYYGNSLERLITTNSGVFVTGEVESQSGNVTGEFIATSFNETYYALLAGSAVTIDCHLGNCFSLTTSTNTTFTFSNPPASGTAFGFSLELTAGGTHTITYPAAVDWAGGSAPDAPASGETDVLVFTTHDGGTTWYGFRAGDAMA